MPEALAAGTRSTELRPALVAAIGERGRWLARWNRDWRWAVDALPEAVGGVSADAETIWQEGAAAERLAILRLVRGEDAARGREWLVAAWKQEKAEFRAEAIQVLAVGLSLADEDVLERALDDRSQGVRAAAATLLTRLPGSALLARMEERADAMLRYTARREPSRVGALMRKVVATAVGRAAMAGQLAAAPPTMLEVSWQRANG